MTAECIGRLRQDFNVLPRFYREHPACYTEAMLDELEFRRHAENAIETLKQHLIEREEEDDAGFEVEEQNGVLNVLFEDPPGKFVITPNTPVRQIWISALATSFKLDWDAEETSFVLPRTGEALTPFEIQTMKIEGSAVPGPNIRTRDTRAL